MYGHSNKALELAILERYGAPAWQAVKAEAGVDIDVFIISEPYPVATNDALVAAAARRVGLPEGEIMMMIGAKWIDVFDRTYGPWMSALGDTLGDFLLALPNVLTRMTLAMPGYHPPQIESHQIAANAIRIRATGPSRRLKWFLRGLLHAAVKHYGASARVMHESRLTLPDQAPAPVSLIATETFRIEWDDLLPNSRGGEPTALEAAA